MKKTLLLMMLFLGIGIYTATAQAYRTINIVDPEYRTVSSTEGISVYSITPNWGNSYTVVLSNNNRCNQGEITNYNFEWYLSYKGKRVSDYYQATIRCNDSSTKSVYAWPDEVPTGNERYVTVQLGREPAKKDPRDDD